MDGVFNITATYSRRSDIMYNYGELMRKHDNFKIDASVLRGKSKYVAWMVSNCGDSSGRLKYARELSKHISLDIYGQCGKLKCRKSKDYSCFDKIEKDYYFYLSFENSICDEYLTEKVWQAMKRYLVPVVLGGANYSKILPPNSYIDVANFTSPKALAGYLKQVAGNMDLYRSYFEWKRHYFVKHESAFETFICTMCEYMNNISSSNSIRIVPSF